LDVGFRAWVICVRLVVSEVVEMRSWSNQKGQGLTEYAMILALVAIVAVAGLSLLGNQINAIICNISNNMATG